jgi:hypothetical protein
MITAAQIKKLFTAKDAKDKEREEKRGILTFEP